MNMMNDHKPAVAGAGLLTAADLLDRLQADEGLFATGRAGSRLTLLFDQAAMTLAREMPVLGERRRFTKLQIIGVLREHEISGTVK